MIPGKYPIGLRPVGGDAAQDRRERRSALHCGELTLNLLTERPHKRFIFEALRHPVKAAVELARFEELIPEQQTEQTMPERVFGVVDLAPLPPQHAGDARFRIAPPGVVDCDGWPCAQKRRAEAGVLTAKLACVEVAREHELILASGIVDHPAEEIFSADLIAAGIKKPRNALIAVG